MAQFIVRNLEDDVRDKLRDLASNRGQSLEEMVREILRSAVMEKEPPKLGLGSQFTNLFGGKGLTEDIPEIRGQSIEPPSFEQ